MTYTFDSCSQQETEEYGRRFSACLEPGDMIAMYGDLGAGKTAFVRGVLRGLGYAGTVSSPTFAIVNEYACSGFTVAHFDVYRISSEEELYGTGFYDYLDGEKVLFIEWSENIPFAVTDEVLRVSIAHTGPETRRIIIEMPKEREF